MPSNSSGGGWWDTYGDDIMGAAMMMYLQNQQNNRDNRPPQITPIPLTPEQQWRFDRGKELFNYSPTRDYVGSYSHQFLQQLNGPQGIGAIGQNHQWLSPNMQNQQFAGGFRFPTVDMSKLPQPWTYNRPDGTGQKPPGQPGGAGQGPGSRPGGAVGGGGGAGAIGGEPRNNDGGTGDGAGLLTPRMPEQWGGRNVQTPGNYPGVTNPNTRNPYLTPDRPTGGGGQGAAPPPTGGGEPAEGSRGVFGRIADAFRNFQNATPGWMDMGITAIVTAVAASAGLPPQLVAPIVRAIMGGGRPNGAGAGDGSGFIPGSISGQGVKP